MQYKYIVLTNTTIGSFMALLDSNIVLISLPTIIRELPNTTDSDGLWIIMGYTLILATVLLAFGRLADIYGRVKLYDLGFVVFTVSSGLCSASPNGISLVVFRLVQGVGAALIFANNAAILTDAFPATERGRALGINQIGGIGGSVSGLVLGGVLTATLGWRSIFWINLPIGGFASLWAYTKLKELSQRPEETEKIDPIGMALFGFGLTIFLLGLTFGALSGWGTIPVVTMIFGLVLIALFGYAETKIKSPMMDIGLFKIRAFSAGILSNLLASLARGSVSLVLVFYFQGALLYDALTAGLLIIPFSLAFVVVGPISGFLSDRYGARGFATAGLIISAVAFIWFSILPAGVSYNIFVLPMILAGAGGGLFLSPNISSIMSSVPITRRGVASAISSTLASSGFLLSLGITFAVLATSMSLSTLSAIFAGLPVQPGELNTTAFVEAMHKIFLIMAGFLLIAIIPSALRNTKKGSPVSKQGVK